MEPIEPKLELFILPESARVVRFAEHQPEYLTLPAITTTDGRVCSQWKLNPNELELLKNGVPVTLVLYTFGHPLQPIMLTVGGLDLRDNGLS